LTLIAKETDMRYYDTIAEFERNGYDIIVDKTWEDLSPKDLFDDCVTDINKLCRDIDSGELDWFMLRVRVLVEGLELASAHVGGCLYADAKEVLVDGLAEDLIGEALAEAKTQVYRLSRKFTELSYAVDAEGIAA
jgi:hypothetical protein